MLSTRCPEVFQAVSRGDVLFRMAVTFDGNLDVSEFGAVRGPLAGDVEVLVVTEFVDSLWDLPVVLEATFVVGGVDHWQYGHGHGEQGEKESDELHIEDACSRLVLRGEG